MKNPSGTVCVTEFVAELKLAPGPCPLLTDAEVSEFLASGDGGVDRLIAGMADLLRPQGKGCQYRSSDSAPSS